MNSIKDNTKSQLKLAQLWHLSLYWTRGDSSLNSLKRVINRLLADDNIDINCKVTINISSHLKDCTALHFLCHTSYRNAHIFIDMLERGVDFTIKNANGQTPLHLSITAPLENITKVDDLWLVKTNQNIIFISSLLSAHVKFENAVNPRDNYGLTHLHGACIANHVEALELFLGNGASPDEAVNFDASIFAGYTPMHFAAEFLSYKVVQTLVSRGANINVEDARGLTPLDILVRRRLIKLDFIPLEEDEGYEKKFVQEISDSERIIELLLEHQCTSAVGISNLHVSCTLENLTIAELLLDKDIDVNYAVPLESPVCPGYTALHFAVNRIETVKMLVMRGAKMDIGNAEGKTPLDICMDKYNVDEVCSILSLDENWSGVCMTDGKTRLLDAVRTMTDLDKFKLFLKNNSKDLAVPKESLILPGCTILHLAVIFSTKNKRENTRGEACYELGIVRECLKNGLDVNAQNAKGQTFAHLAFISGKNNILDLLRIENFDGMSEIINLVDQDNLSLLHVVCALRINALVVRFLDTSLPNVAYKGNSISMGIFETGMTPLHVATIRGFHDIVEMLLANGADFHVTDKNGMAPIHYLLKLDLYNGQRTANILFAALLENPKDQKVDNVGLSYLHAACYFGHLEAAEKLIDLGSNVNVALSYKNILDRRFLASQLYFSVDYVTITPLFLAQFRHDVGIIYLLLRHDADFLDLVPDRLFEMSDFRYTNDIEKLLAIPLKTKDITCSFMLHLWDNPDFQRSMEEKLGLTKLHIACHMKNEEAVRTTLYDGIDVNSQVNADAKIFAGCTPLHLLLTNSTWRANNYQNTPANDVESIIALLLDFGADVTIANAKKDTPIHVFSQRLISFTNVEHCTDLLLNAPQNFKVNPVNAEGVSHFHLACEWHKVEIIEKFLESGTVDVNQPTDFWIRYNAGLTPLHSALHRFMEGNNNWNKLLQTLDLLLKNGANIHAIDGNGETLLHKRAVLRSPGFNVLEKLISHGASIESKNALGETIFDTHTHYWNFAGFSSLCLKYVYLINSWNNLTGEGCIAKLFLSQQYLNIAMNTDFRKLIELSDITTIDKMGRTVIHNCVAILQRYARNSENHLYVIESFMEKGVNIDHQDVSGQTAFHYAARMENECAFSTLLACGADINITDNSGRSVFCYIAMECNKCLSKYDSFCEMAKIFNVYVKELQYLKLEVSELNTNISPELQEFLPKIPVGGDINDTLKQFFSEVETTKGMDVGVGSLKLFDFLNETGGVSLYPYLSVSERFIIDDYFKSIDRKELGLAFGIIKLQFRKMTSRLDLIDLAFKSLRILLGFSVPGLCQEIARFLTNTDLKNMIACIDFMEDIEKK